MDGLVVAESTFESSANYRSAVIRGCLETTTGVDKSHVLQRISERIIPGRHAEVGPSTRREEAATLGLSLRIEEGKWLMKERRGGPGEPPEPVSVWCGSCPCGRSPMPRNPRHGRSGRCRHRSWTSCGRDRS